MQRGIHMQHHRPTAHITPAAIQAITPMSSTVAVVTWALQFGHCIFTGLGPNILGATY